MARRWLREQSSQYQRDRPFSTEEIQVKGGVSVSATAPHIEQVTTPPP